MCLGHQEQGFARPALGLQDRSTDFLQRSSNRGDEMTTDRAGVLHGDGKVDRSIEIVQGLEEIDLAALPLEELDKLLGGGAATPTHLLEDTLDWPCRCQQVETTVGTGSDDDSRRVARGQFQGQREMASR
jgi:hypothetical protein